MFRGPGLPITGTAIVRGHGRRSGEPQRVASFDIKLGLLNGPHAKTHKAGHRYNVVPFTHSTPGSQRQKGMPMPLDGDMKDLGRRSKNPWVVNLEARLRSTPEPMATG